jgi:hypothetical protein
MTAIVIETELSLGDWGEYLSRVRQRAVARSARPTLITSVVTAATVLVLLLLFGRAPDMRSVLLGAALPLVSFLVARQLQLVRIKTEPVATFLGPVRFELSADGIHSRGPGMQSISDWTRIREIDDTPTTIFLWFDRVTGYVIPKRDIDPAVLPTLVGQLLAWHAARLQPSLPQLEQGENTQATAAPIVTRRAGPPAGFLRALIGNLRAGLKLFFLRRVEATEFTVSFDQLVALLGLAVALFLAADWLLAGPDTEFDGYGLYGWTYYILAGLWAAALIARMHGSQTDTRALLVTWLATLPAFIVIFGLAFLLPIAQARPIVLLAIAAGVLVGVSWRAVYKVFGFASPGALVLIIGALVAVPWALQTQLYLNPHLWTVPEEQEEPVQDEPQAESILFEQSDRIADAVGSMAPQRPGVVDTYFVGFAGDGAQSVFRDEARFGADVFAKRYGTGRRALQLINDNTDRATYPLATVSGLHYALQLIADDMDKEEDVLVLLLTSHGSREDGIAVRNVGLPLADLQPDDLRSALDDSGIKWRVIIVSACYAGIFVEPLKSDSTLVITAADADHTSFGCADDRDLTYFGEAFLRDALPVAPSLEAAFARARKLIAEREKAEKLTPSNPQIFVGSAIRKKLAEPGAPAEEPNPGKVTPSSTLTALQF